MNDPQSETGVIQAEKLGSQPRTVTEIIMAGLSKPEIPVLWIDSFILRHDLGSVASGYQQIRYEKAFQDVSRYHLTLTDQDKVFHANQITFLSLPAASPHTTVKVLAYATDNNTFEYYNTGRSIF